jgi:hypothetical protein
VETGTWLRRVHGELIYHGKVHGGRRWGLGRMGVGAQDFQGPERVILSQGSLGPGATTRLLVKAKRSQEPPRSWAGREWENEGNRPRFLRRALTEGRLSSPVHVEKRACWAFVVVGHGNTAVSSPTASPSWSFSQTGPWQRRAVQSPPPAACRMPQLPAGHGGGWAPPLRAPTPKQSSQGPEAPRPRGPKSHAQGPSARPEE